jgi:cbb3-type cytochrome c oxidase subunit III
MRALAFLLAFALAAPALAEDVDGGSAPDPGKAVFTKRCAGCHGDDGKAQTKVGKKYDIADFTDPKWSKGWSRAQVEKTIRTGVKGKMPALGDKLSEAELHAVSAYVFELAGAPGHK